MNAKERLVALIEDYREVNRCGEHVYDEAITMVRIEVAITELVEQERAGWARSYHQLADVSGRCERDLDGACYGCRELFRLRDAAIARSRRERVS